MTGTPHLSPDQLSALAERSAAIPESSELFEHLAQCQSCRNSLFLLSSTTQSVPKSVPPWLIAAAVVLAVALPISILRDLRSRTRSPLPATSASIHSLPVALGGVSLLPAQAKQDMVPILFQAAYAPPRNRFVVQTAVGERWISFDTLKLFCE